MRGSPGPPSPACAPRAARCRARLHACMQAAVNFTSGIAAAIAATLLTQPADVVRTRMQLGLTPTAAAAAAAAAAPGAAAAATSGAWSTFTAVLKQQGPSALLTGMPAARHARALSIPAPRTILTSASCATLVPCAPCPPADATSWPPPTPAPCTARRRHWVARQGVHRCTPCTYIHIGCTYMVGTSHAACVYLYTCPHEGMRRRDPVVP